MINEQTVREKREGEREERMKCLVPKHGDHGLCFRWDQRVQCSQCRLRESRRSTFSSLLSALRRRRRRRCSGVFHSMSSSTVSLCGQFVLRIVRGETVLEVDRLDQVTNERTNDG